MGHNDIFRGNLRSGLDTVWVGPVALIYFFGFEELPTALREYVPKL
jgi:hypothetical protein